MKIFFDKTEFDSKPYVEIINIAKNESGLSNVEFWEFIFILLIKVKIKKIEILNNKYGPMIHTYKTEVINETGAIKKLKFTKFTYPFNSSHEGKIYPTPKNKYGVNSLSDPCKLKSKKFISVPAENSKIEFSNRYCLINLAKSLGL